MYSGKITAEAKEKSEQATPTFVFGAKIKEKIAGVLSMLYMLFRNIFVPILCFYLSKITSGYS